MAENNKKMEEQLPSLLKVIAADIFVRHWLVTALAALLISSAMLLSYTSHQTRRYTALLEIENKQQRDLQIQWERLRLELTTLSEADRISSEARKQLKMEDVTLKTERVISL